VPTTSNRKLWDQLGSNVFVVVQSFFHHSREVMNSLLLARRAFAECPEVRTTCILHLFPVFKEVLFVIFEALDLFGRESGFSSSWGQDLAEFRSYPCRRSNEVYHPANFFAGTSQHPIHGARQCLLGVRAGTICMAEDSAPMIATTLSVKS
jgi:hypothetical protein